MDDIKSIDESLFTNLQYAETIVTEASLYEAIDKSIIVLKKFISELRAKAQKFMVDVKATIRRTALPARLLKMKKDLKDIKSAGKSTVEMVDYYKLSKYYMSMCKELTNDLKKPLMEQRYKDRERFQNEVNYISDKVDRFDEKMDSLMKQKITVNIDKAIQIVESELKGETLEYKAFIKTLDEFDKLVADVQKLERDSLAVSNNYLKNNHLNIFQRILHTVGQKLSKWMSKVISTVVFFFA